MDLDRVGWWWWLQLNSYVAAVPERLVHWAVKGTNNGLSKGVTPGTFFFFFVRDDVCMYVYPSSF